MRGTASEIVVFQRHRVWNTGASSNACTSTSLRRRRMQIAEDVGERKRMLRPERQQQRVLGGRRLQLEVELAAEPLAQRQAPRLVDAAAERRVQHELHAARFVEEALEHQRVLRRHHAERARACRPDRRPPARPRPCDAGFRREPVDRGRLAPLGTASAVAPRSATLDVGAQVADRARQLVAARRRFAEPERNVRRRALARRRRARRRSPTCSTRHDALPS